MTSALMLLAASSLSFNCVVDPPRNVIIAADGAVSSKVLGLPPEMNQWAFGVTINDKPDELKVKLDWPGDPIRAGKAIGGLSVGRHDYSFMSIHAGPCLFTQTSCQFMFTLSVQQDGNAHILVQPAALMSDGEWSRPFQVYMTGRCTPKKAS